MSRNLLRRMRHRPQCSCSDVSHSGQMRGGGGGWGPDSTVSNCVSGTKPVLFGPVRGQSHSAASEPKVSPSVILILHCKQTGCIQFRCMPGAEISSLSAAGKNYICVCLYGRQTGAARLQEKQAIQVQQTGKMSVAPVLLCIMQNPAVSWKRCVRFVEQNWTEQSGTLSCAAGGGVWLRATVTDVLPRTPRVPDGMF